MWKTITSAFTDTTANDYNTGTFNLSSTESTSASPVTLSEIVGLLQEHLANNRVKEAYDYLKNFENAPLADQLKNASAAKICKNVLDLYKQKFPMDVSDVYYEKYFSVISSVTSIHLKVRIVNFPISGFPPLIRSLRCLSQPKNWFKIEKIPVQHNGFHGYRVAKKVLVFVRQIVERRRKAIKYKKQVVSKFIVAISDYGNVYWSLLEKILSDKLQIVAKPDSPFYVNMTSFSQAEKNEMLDICRYYIAVNRILHGEHEKAIEILKILPFDKAFCAQAGIYKRMADNITIEGSKGDEQTLTKKRALLSKAQQCLHSARCAAVFDELIPASNFCDEIFIDLAAENFDDQSFLVNESCSSFHNNLADFSASSATDVRYSTTPVRYRTPPSNRPPSESFGTPKTAIFEGEKCEATPVMNSTAAPFLSEIGQTIDSTVRSLTNSNDSMVKSVLEQNKVLNDTIKTITDQMREMALVNKHLAETITDVTATNKKMIEELNSIRLSSSTATSFGQVAASAAAKEEKKTTTPSSAFAGAGQP
uniref:Uncharacterized protein n=1 Tax=Romanomermis culicivorax TaxID=13658 RepID=A0A915I3B0_ROMCU